MTEKKVANIFGANSKLPPPVVNFWLRACRTDIQRKNNQDRSHSIKKKFNNVIGTSRPILLKY